MSETYTSRPNSSDADSLKTTAPNRVSSGPTVKRPTIWSDNRESEHVAETRVRLQSENRESEHVARRDVTRDLER